MATPLESQLERLAALLAIPQREWTEAQNSELWCSVARAPTRDLLVKFAAKRVGNWEDAEDVVQRCLIDLSMNGTYDPTGRAGNTFSAWLYGCLRNHAREFCRRRLAQSRHLAIKRSSQAGPDSNQQTEPTDEGVGKKLLEEDIENDELLSLMSARDREVWERLQTGQTDEEVAVQMGLGVDNVRQIRFRSAKKLSTFLGVPANQLSEVLRKRRCPPPPSQI